MRKLLSILLAAATLFTFSLGASAKSASGDLSSKKAIELALSAREHHWNSMNGHIPSKKNKACTIKTFQYKDTEYRYLCSEINTKTKLTKYLNESFTLNAISKGYKKYRFIEYKGKLAQPNADGGSLLEWNKAKAKLIYSRKGIRQFEFTVPFGEKIQYEKKKVTFVKVRGNWQINAFDAVR
jgi:iseA protein